jgi:DNA-binding transcriptional regulator LsrR (DeoR family)
MSHPAPIRHGDPETDKRAALRLASAAAHKADVAESTRNNAIWFAAEQGASLREIATSTGLSHMTVKRILERSASDA